MDAYPFGVNVLPDTFRAIQRYRAGAVAEAKLMIVPSLLIVLQRKYPILGYCISGLPTYDLK